VRLVVEWIPMSETAANSGFDPVAGESPVPLAAGAAAPSEALSEAPEGIAADDIEKLLRQAERALSSVDAPSGGSPSAFKAFKFEELAPAATSQDVATLELLRDVELDLKIELGRTHMYLEEVLKLRKGSVVALDKLAGDPVDIFVNGRLIARGEVLVLNDNFCVRVAELVAGEGPTA
jgi:flagellar motor switch protein FliN/FliY